MKLTNVYKILGFLGLPLVFFNAPLAIGWFVGHAMMVILDMLRERFYEMLLELKEFNLSFFLGYIFLVFVLLTGPLLLAFFFMDKVSPFTLFGAYFLDRVLMFIIPILEAKEVSYAK